MEKAQYENKAFKPKKKVVKKEEHEKIDGKINVYRYAQKHSLSLTEAKKQVAKIEENEE